MSQGDRSIPAWELEVQDPSSGWPDAIPLTLSEDELVILLVILQRFCEPDSPLQLKLRAAQVAAFAKAHG